MDADITIRRYSQMLRVRVSAGLPQTVEIAARRTLTSPAEWMRRSLLAALNVYGVHLDADGHIRVGTSSNRQLNEG